MCCQKQCWSKYLQKPLAHYWTTKNTMHFETYIFRFFVSLNNFGQKFLCIVRRFWGRELNIWKCIINWCKYNLKVFIVFCNFWCSMLSWRRGSRPLGSFMHNRLYWFPPSWSFHNLHQCHWKSVEVKLQKSALTIYFLLVIYVQESCPLETVHALKSVYITTRHWKVQ